MKDVNNSMCPKPSEETSQSAGLSARYALPSNLYGEEADTFTFKCTDCEALLLHVWVPLEPRPLFEITDPIEELIKKRRKILMCTNCGKMGLKS